MTVSIASITFDSTDPEPLARWSAERIDAKINANMDGLFLIVASGDLPTQLAFQRVEDPTPGKNKVHLDVHTDGVSSTPIGAVDRRRRFGQGRCRVASRGASVTTDQVRTRSCPKAARRRHATSTEIGRR